MGPAAAHQKAQLIIRCLRCVQDAALHNRLGSETYQRLGLGLVW